MSGCSIITVADLFFFSLNVLAGFHLCNGRSCSHLLEKNIPLGW